MRAMILRKTGPVTDSSQPLEFTELPKPVAASNEVLIHVHVCGVCHTELDEIEGRLTPPELPIIPGHQVVGKVAECGASVTRFRVGDRVGVGWIHFSSGAEDENLSPLFRATGRDANGGYAEFMTVGEDYAYPIPAEFSDVEAAPLLCAGAVGYRSLKLTGIRDGEALGLMGFGGSAHLVIQMARFLYPSSPVSVFAREAETRKFALSLGAVWAGETEEQCPVPLSAIIDTTPAWTPVVAALRNLRPGGRLVINAIRKEDHDKSALLGLSYHEHLWLEREIKSVANVTQFDLSEFLPIAARVPLRPRVQVYSLADANQALIDLKLRPIQGAKVLLVGSS